MYKYLSHILSIYMGEGREMLASKEYMIALEKTKGTTIYFYFVIKGTWIERKIA